MKPPDQSKSTEQMPGDSLGHPRDTPPFIPDYALIRPIGRGSYGEVWLARNATGSYHAVKVVYRATFESDKPYEREFTGIKEFEPISRSHPAQVDILHVGRNEQAGYFYYVMELADDASLPAASKAAQDVAAMAKADVPSSKTSSATASRQIDPTSYQPRTLRALLREQNRLLVSQCLEIAASLAEALQHLHAHGLVHRDIKPSNIIFVNGRPKLADIGLVARADATLSFVGTEGYLPPEGPGKSQADIYSLGKVLYEMASGKDRNQFPEPPTLLKELPDREAFQELNEVILKACAHDATERYQSAAEMHVELVSLRAGKSLKRSRLLEKRLAQLTRLSGVGIAVTALVVAGYFYQQRQTQKANRLAAELQITHGVHVMDEGDLSGSLLWFVQAMEQARWTKEEIEMHRFRFGAVFRQCPRLVQLFLHERGPGRVDFSPDGRRLLTYYWTTNVQIFDVATGESLAVLRHSNDVWHATFSADGQRVLTVSGDAALVWNASADQPIGPPIRHGARAGRVITDSDDGAAQIWDALAGVKLSQSLNHPMHVGFSRDGRSVITADASNTVQIWNADSGEPNGPAFRPPQKGRLLEVSRDGLSVLTATNQTAHLRDARTGEPLLPPLEHNEHNEPIVHGQLSSEGSKILCIGGGTGSARVWDSATGEKLPLSLKDPDPSVDADLSPDGRFVAVGDWDGLAQIFEASTGKLITAPLRHNGSVLGVRFHPDGRQLATANGQQLVRLWDIASGQFSGPVFKHAERVTWTGFSPDGRRILTASWDGTAQLWDAVTGKPVALALEHRGFRHYGHPSFSRDGKRFLIASAQNVIQVRDAATGEPIGQPMPHQATVLHAEFSPDRKLVVTATESGTVQLWDASTGEAVVRAIPKLPISAFASFSPDGRRLATIGHAADNSFQPQVWDLETGQPLTPPIQTIVRPTYSVTFSPDGNRLLTRVFNGQARVWNAHTGQPIMLALTHDGSEIPAACFSPDGRRVLTSGGHRAARLWDAATGQRLTRPLEHEMPVQHAVFSPDGGRIITASADHTARIWDASTGLPLTPPLQHKDAVTYAEFSPDGRRVITASADGTARVWEFESILWPVEDLRLLAQLLSGRTIDATGSFSPLAPQALTENLRKLKSRQPEYFQESEK